MRGYGDLEGGGGRWRRLGVVKERKVKITHRKAEGEMKPGQRGTVEEMDGEDGMKTPDDREDLEGVNLHTGPDLWGGGGVEGVANPSF